MDNNDLFWVKTFIVRRRFQAGEVFTLGDWENEFQDEPADARVPKAKKIGRAFSKAVREKNPVVAFAADHLGPFGNGKDDQNHRTYTLLEPVALPVRQ